MRYTFAKHEIAYWKRVSRWNENALKNENPEILVDIHQFYFR